MGCVFFVANQSFTEFYDPIEATVPNTGLLSPTKMDIDPEQS